MNDQTATAPPESGTGPGASPESAPGPREPRTPGKVQAAVVAAARTVGRTARRYPVTTVVVLLVLVTSVVGVVLRVSHGTTPSHFGPLRVFAASTGLLALVEIGRAHV